MLLPVSRKFNQSNPPKEISIRLMDAAKSSLRKS